MNRRVIWAIIAACLTVNQAKGQAVAANRVNFDSNWRFCLGGAQGAEATGFNDKSWRKLDLPHDFSIEDRLGTNSPFNQHGVGQVNGGFTSQGTGWYRKTFTIPVSSKGKRIIVKFDGVYMNSDVFINGQLAGNHPYGYTSFFYDITNEIKFGASNTIAVEVKNEGRNSRWYSGSGIYRHVWLETLDPIHIAEWGMAITTSEVSSDKARIKIRSRVINETLNKASFEVVTRIISPQGAEVASVTGKVQLDAGATIDLADSTVVKLPQLWSCESPLLYQAVTEVVTGQNAGSVLITNFGIRQISVDAMNGLRLNGKSVKLKGGCFHLDNGPLGSRAYDRAEERKVEILKANGFNAIRCSHNPPSPAFLDACDRLGILVIDEAFDMWNYGKNPYDYHLYFKDWWQRDIENMVIRDRNHPSIIMWSIGNEIPEKSSPEGIETAGKLAAYVRMIDLSRPVTSAVNDLNPNKDPYFSVLDVCGYNYAVNDGDMYVKDHQRKPERIMFGTESYPLEAFGAWMAVKDNAYVIGDFVWTAWDYIGEAGIGWLGYPQSVNYYPWNLAFCGDIDVCGFKRPQSYYRDALWKTGQVSLFVKPPVPSYQSNPDLSPWSKWNWVDAVSEWNFKGSVNKPLEVSVYSSCDRVELLLNGKSLGFKNTNRSTKFMATYTVPYQPGVLIAVGYIGMKQVMTSELRTATTPVKIKLAADRSVLTAGVQDLSYITVELIDSKGVVNPTADNLVRFEVSGDAAIVGVGNGNPRSLESYQLPQRKAWKGRCLVIVKAGTKPGKITLKATSTSLAPAKVEFEVK